MTLREKIKIDVAVNRGNGKGKIIVVAYRIANHITHSKNPLVRFFGFPFKKLYRWFFIWIMGCEIPEETRIGTGLQVWHGQAIVINPAAVIGNNLLIRHSTTIGNKYFGSPSPVIGNNVDIGAHSILIGDIKIGDNVTIGAASLITKSIPANSIAYGNPLKIIPKPI